jgi:hypothetical protein
MVSLAVSLRARCGPLAAKAAHGNVLPRVKKAREAAILFDADAWGAQWRRPMLLIFIKINF